MSKYWGIKEGITHWGFAKYRISRVEPNFIFSDFEKLDTFVSGFSQFRRTFRWWKEFVTEEDTHPILIRAFFETLGSEATKVQYIWK